MQLNWIQNKKVPRWYIKKQNLEKSRSIHIWGEIWGSNPCIPEPQSGVLTTSPIPPFLNYFSILTSKRKNIKFFLIFLLYLYKDMY